MARSHNGTLDLHLDELCRAMGLSELHYAGTPDSGGWSSATVFVADDNDTQFVIRLEPQGEAMFQNHDLRRQIDCMTHLRLHGMPVPEVVFQDLEASVLPRPGYVMERIAGYVPSDRSPTFIESGFLQAATERQQRRYLMSLLSQMALLHQAPLPTFLDEASPHEQLTSTNGLREGENPTSGRILNSAFDALLASVPTPIDPPVMLWGDARPANTVVAPNFTVAGMFDWELASIGQGEHDVAWLMEMNRMRAPEGTPQPVLPGFLPDNGIWIEWQSLMGRQPRDIEWYHLFAAFQIAVYLNLNLWSLVRNGELDKSNKILEDNRALRRLTALLG